MADEEKKPKPHEFKTTMDANREKSGLKPWDKGGPSPNKGGPHRTETVKAFEEWLEKHALTAAKQALLRCLESEDEGIALKAAALVFDRRLGKPRQEITGADGGPIVMGLVVLPAEQPLPAIDVSPIIGELVAKDEDEDE